MLHMYGNIPYVFDVWAEPFAHPPTKELHGSALLALFDPTGFTANNVSLYRPL